MLLAARPGGHVGGGYTSGARRRATSRSLRRGGRAAALSDARIRGRGRRLRLGLRRGLVRARIEAAVVLLGRRLAGRGLRPAGVLGRARHRRGGARARVSAAAVAALDVLAARIRVAAVERRGDERLLRRREVAAVAALDAVHVVAPDLRRERAAVDR